MNSGYVSYSGNVLNGPDWRIQGKEGVHYEQDGQECFHEPEPHLLPGSFKIWVCRREMEGAFTQRDAHR